MILRAFRLEVGLFGLMELYKKIIKKYLFRCCLKNISNTALLFGLLKK